jgi:hypothetical protein
MVLFSMACRKSNKSNEIGDFVAASKAAMPAVVHIKTLLKSAIDNSNFRQP